MPVHNMNNDINITYIVDDNKILGSKNNNYFNLYNYNKRDNTTYKRHMGMFISLCKTICYYNRY